MEQTKRTKKPINHYVDNERLTQEMIAWHHEVKAAKREGQPIPQMPPFVAECVVKIANELVKKHNYRNYSWTDEMVSDGIEVCVMYLHNFDPHAKTRSGEANPFGYISYIIETAFGGRITREKQQEYFKNKSVEILNHDGTLEFDLAAEHGKEQAQGIMADFMDRVYKYEEDEKARIARSEIRKAKNKARREAKEGARKEKGAETTKLKGFFK